MKKFYNLGALQTLKVGSKRGPYGVLYDYRLRDRVDVVKSKLYPDLENKENERAEFLPVQWRSSLRLDGGEYILIIL